MLQFVLFQSVQTVIGIALAVYLAIDLWQLSRSGTSYALRELSNLPSGPEPWILRLSGRQTGLLGWLGALGRPVARIAFEPTVNEQLPIGCAEALQAVAVLNEAILSSARPEGLLR